MIMRSHRFGFGSMSGRAILALLGALLLAVPAGARAVTDAPGQKGTPAVSAAAAPSSPIHQEVLDNGLRILLQEDHSKPLVGVCLFVNGGSRTETPTLSGLSHYYEHLIFRGGSTKQKELEFRREMQRLGEESGGYTTNDYTCYGFTTPTAQIDEGLWRAVDAWMNVKITETKVARERQVVMEEFNQGEDRPDYKVYYQIERLMFRDHPYKRDTIGLKDAIQKSTLATFRTFYAERYVPNQMILAVVGDFDTKAMSAKLKKAFAPYKRGKDDFELGLTEAPQAEFRMGVESMKTPSTWTYVGFHVPPYSDPDAPALTVLASLLGKGTSSRLYRALKDKENLVTSIDADFEIRRDPGMFLIGGQMPPENEARVFGIVRDELHRLATEPVPAAELSRVKSSLLYSYAFDAQTLFDRAERLALFELMSDVSVEAAWPRLLESVTAADLQRVAQRYFAADLASYSVIRPDGTTGPSQRDIEGMLDPWRAGWPALASARAGSGVGKVRRETLSSGVTLLLQEDHATPVVAVTAIGLGGQWIEPEGLAGVSNMAAVLLRRGAGSLSAQAISERTDALGMRLATAGTPDYASITWQAPAANFDKSWEIFRDVATKPTFPATEVAKVREDLIRQAQSIGDRPFELTNLKFAEALYKNSPYRKPLLGDETTIPKIRTADLRKAYQTMFSGSNLVISVVGDFDADHALELARRGFGSLKKGTPVVVGEIRDEPAKEKRPIFIDKDQEQVTYNTGWLTCSVRDPDYVPLRAAVALMGDKVFFKYVYEKGVAYRSWFYMQDRMGQSSAQNEMGVTPANFDMASGGVLGDIKEMFGGPIPATEVKKSVDKLLSRWYLGAQRSDQIAARLAYFEAAGLGYEFTERYPDMVRKVTPSQVLGVAKKYFDPNTYTRVAVGKEPGKGATSAAPGR
jgi:zinc protease